MGNKDKQQNFNAPNHRAAIISFVQRTEPGEYNIENIRRIARLEVHPIVRLSAVLRLEKIEDGPLLKHIEGSDPENAVKFAAGYRQSLSIIRPMCELMALKHDNQMVRFLFANSLDYNAAQETFLEISTDKNVNMRLTALCKIPYDKNHGLIQGMALNDNHFAVRAVATYLIAQNNDKHVLKMAIEKEGSPELKSYISYLKTVPEKSVADHFEKLTETLNRLTERQFVLIGTNDKSKLLRLFIN